MPVRLICASHTPLMDHVDAAPAVAREVRGRFPALANEVRDYAPELVVILPEALALGCVAAVRGDDVDVAVSYRMQADHGFAQLAVLLAGSVDRYPTLPIHINCAGPPLPSFRRVRALGAAVGRWAAGLDRRVLVMGSGGLSHDPPIPSIDTAPPPVAEMLIAGRNPPIEARRAREEANYETARRLARGEGKATPLNPGWDRDFMARMAAGELDALDGVDDADLTRAAGCGGHEVRTWVAAYAAASAAGPLGHRHVFYHDIPQWNAGMGIAAAEPVALAATA